MSNEPNRKITLPSNGGMFQDLAKRVKLIFRLLADSRVSPLVKILPIGSAVYMLFPDIAPGPVDDAAIIWLSTYLFVELCPPNVVAEHMEAIEGKPAISAQPQQSAAPVQEEDIIEGECREDTEEAK